MKHPLLFLSFTDSDTYPLDECTFIANCVTEFETIFQSLILVIFVYVVNTCSTNLKYPPDVRVLQYLNMIYLTIQ